MIIGLNKILPDDVVCQVKKYLSIIFTRCR